MARGRRGTRRSRELASQGVAPGASEKDFSEAPIFKMYGPSPSMTKHPRWRNGSTVPTREGQRRSGNTYPRTEKQLGNGHRKSRPSPISPQDVAAQVGNSDGDGQRDGKLE